MSTMTRAMWGSERHGDPQLDRLLLLIPLQILLGAFLLHVGPLPLAAPLLLTGAILLTTLTLSGSHVVATILLCAAILPTTGAPGAMAEMMVFVAVVSLLAVLFRMTLPRLQPRPASGIQRLPAPSAAAPVSLDAEPLPAPAPVQATPPAPAPSASVPAPAPPTAAAAAPPAAAPARPPGTRLPDAAEGVDQLKHEFLTCMSHELRTPLNSIIGYAELLLMDLEGEPKRDPETREDIRAIHDNGRLLLMLIDDILDLIQIEAGQMALVLEEVSPRSLLTEARAGGLALASRLDKPLTVTLDLADDLPVVTGDRPRLQQALEHLVANAIKFCDEGDVTLRGRAGDEGLLLEVQDSGPGIREQDLPFIFDKFWQADGSDTRRAGGTGLGLCIARHLVRLHRGRITVESRQGEGSRFTIHLPCEPPPPGPPPLSSPLPGLTV